MLEEQLKPAAPRCLIRPAILHTAAKDKTVSCLAEAWGCLALPQKHALSSCCGQPLAQKVGEREEEEEAAAKEEEEKAEEAAAVAVAAAAAAHRQCQDSLLQHDLQVVG